MHPVHTVCKRHAHRVQSQNAPCQRVQNAHPCAWQKAQYFWEFWAFRINSNWSYTIDTSKSTVFTSRGSQVRVLLRPLPLLIRRGFFMPWCFSTGFDTKYSHLRLKTYEKPYARSIGICIRFYLYLNVGVCIRRVHFLVVNTLLPHTVNILAMWTVWPLRCERVAGVIGISIFFGFLWMWTLW